jgi:hypothetical protein
MPFATRYEDISSDTSINSTASSCLAKALHWKIQKLTVGTIDETMPLVSLDVVLNVPKKVPPHPPFCHICPPDLAKPLLSTTTPTPYVVSTKPSALSSDMVTASGLVPAPDFPPTMTPTSDLVEPVTGSETTKTPVPDLLPTMTLASDLVELCYRFRNH